MDENPTYKELEKRIQELEHAESGHIRIKQSLSRSEALLDATERLSKVGGWEWDIEKQSMFWTKEVYRIHDFQPNEFAQGSTEHIERGIECYDPEDRPVIMAAFRECAEKGQAYDLEFPFTTAMGRRIWIRTVAEPVLEGDRIVKVAGNLLDISDRKQTEEALRRSEQRYREVVEDQTEIICRFDPDNTYIFVNDVYCRFFGKSKEELIGKKWFPDAYSEDVAMINAKLMTMSQSNPVVTIENRVFSGEGDLRWMQFVNRGFYDHAGNLLEIQSVGRDITERKQAEDALGKSETELRAIYERSPNIMLLVDEDRKVLKANRPALKSTGRTHDEIMGLSDGEALHCIHAFDDPAGCGFGVDCEACVVRNTVFDTIKTGDTHKNIEAHVQFNIADEIVELYFSISTSPLDIDGARRILVCLEDITERKQTEKELLAERDKLSCIFEGMQDGVYIANQQNDLLYVNKPLMADFGPPEGRKCYAYLHDREDVCPWCKNPEVFAGKAQQWEWTSPKNGKTYDLMATLLRNVDGSTSRMEVFRDITAQKLAEKEREKLEAQLFQSQKMEAIGTLAGGVAHDFNNLLMVISGHGQLLLERKEEGDPERYALELICQAGERAAGLTRQLLAFSRKQVLQPQVISLNNLVENVIKMLQRMIGEDVKIATVLSPDLGLVKADPGQVEQVLLNLVVNARDAMPQGGQLTIETANAQVDAEHSDRGAWEIPPGPYVQLSVTDTGVGMSPEVTSHIFEPFFTTKGLGEGTGLGLSTVYGIVKQSGGHILVYSEPGQGTTFKIYLPRSEATAGQGGDTVVGVPEVPGGSETILVAEDDPGVRAMVVHYLTSCGYHVLEAADPEEALTVATDHPGPVALLLTDVVMPGAGGPELAVRLHTLRPDTPVLFISGYTDGTVARHGVLLDEVEFLQKPFSKRDLARKVREMLDG